MKNMLIVLFILAAGAMGKAQDSTVKPFLVKTIGPLPYLEYGTGDDRLGGAKMTYLDTNVVLKVVDSTGTDYKVQLSKYHIAYVSKANVAADSGLRLGNENLSGSWMVSGEGKYDLVSISLPNRLPYKSVQQISPSRIVVDLYGVTSNTNWITQRGTSSFISSVWYEQPEDDVMRVFIELGKPVHWGYSIAYDSLGSRLQIKVKRPPESLRLRDMVIAIDAGHGGSNLGASGKNSKVLEKNLTLQYAKALEKLLNQKGATVVMTRTTDADVTQPERAALLRKAEPDLLISIHFNSSGNPAVSGTSTYYRYIGFQPLTQAILKRMLELNFNNYGNIGGFNFALSGPTEYPNCLVEVGFLSNEDEEKRMLKKGFDEDVANKIMRGIVDWLRAMD
ncbi:N-acetylmuramoyl-L-alanine amidase [Pseudobacter ginsenosidimutans]|uniref:N-acetylmuramoyl-L-alanine amidase n=1 Tax=Pseudobacter ginsenosidimutans TaxID=661488 RepID=A0A4V2F107_9BACT|nr:N-acetylmuramoyl-L-alanine amidase [Pseudobacter ginsenosidimutans]QEC41253.1 N-acetylmuramoyl-L-alanine amidase [Pseudobacter ginsenosidimutans]RZS71971.1 N-acetylmuramoyl-L-alanine amidase [Pseudobacter ginsenosidimutans]